MTMSALSVESRLNAESNVTTISNSYLAFHYHHHHHHQHQHQSPPVTATTAATVTNNRLIDQLLSWRKSWRTGRAKIKSAASLNSVCVMVRGSEQHRRALADGIASPGVGRSPLAEYLHSHIDTTFAPVVSFVNKGEGRISMRLMERVMVNENELYSMSIADHNSASPPADRRPVPPPPVPPVRNDSLYGDDDESGGEPESQPWFHGSMARDRAVEILSHSPIGSFIVRHSATMTCCYALSVRVALDRHSADISHYLIVITPQRTYKIKGFTKEFSSLRSLIVHHSIMPEMLPCALKLPINRDDSRQLGTASRAVSLLTGMNDSGEDVLVDVDSDPNYQRILSQFRKTMLNCK